MKKTTIKQFSLLCFIFALLGATRANAQWVVHDPTSFLQAIENSIHEVEESSKILEQGREYYDALKNVHHLIKDARQVKDCSSLSLQMIADYKNAVSKINSAGYFTSDQVAIYIGQQNRLMTSVAGTLDDLKNIIVNTGMSLSDKDRLDAIDTYHSRIAGYYHQSRMLNQQMLGEITAVEQRKTRKRLERELLR